MNKILTSLLLLLVCLTGMGQVLKTPKPATIEFVVNTDRVITNDNYVNFIKNIVPFVRENADQIDSIAFIGSASPEGNKEHNVHLAEIRAEKIYSFISDYIPKSKIVVNNDYDLFLSKTGLNEDDYGKLRAAYIEIHMRPEEPPVEIKPVHDTIYITDYIKDVVRDTIYIWDTVYFEKPLKRIPVLAIKTNLASELIAAPNVQAELYTHWAGISLEFDYTFPWYKIHDKYFYYQVLNGTVGVRKYFRDDYTGHYIGAYGNTAIYDLCFFKKDKGWQGELYGAGLSYGYVFTSKKNPRIKFEPYIRAGWFNTKFDKYHASQPWDDKYYYDWYQRASDFVPRRFNMNYFGPTEIGFNFTFDLVCIRKY